MRNVSNTLATAQALAIERLVRIVQDSPSDREARMAAVALLDIKVTELTPVEATIPAVHAPAPATASPPPLPLTPEELTILRRRLPHIRPERFLRKPPTYWRSMLADYAPAPLRQTG